MILTAFIWKKIQNFCRLGMVEVYSRRRSSNMSSFPKEKALKCVKICLLLSKDRRQRQSINVAFLFAYLERFFPIIELYHRRISKRQTSLSFFAHLGHFVALKKRFCCGDKRILKFDDPRKAANGFL